MNADIDRDTLTEVVLVFNGSLGMSPGKMIGQAFQAREYMTGPSYRRWKDWLADGTRTIVKVAKTPAMFERVCAEVPGFVMRDEGFTEVEAGAATLFVAAPFLHRDRPAILDNKKVALL